MCLSMSMEQDHTFNQITPTRLQTFYLLLRSFEWHDNQWKKMAAHARHIFKPAHYVQVLYGLFIYPGDGKVVRNMTTSSHMCECLWAPKSLIRHVFFVDEKFTTANYERSCHCVKWRFRPRLLKSSCIAEIKWSSLVLSTIVYGKSFLNHSKCFPVGLFISSITCVGKIRNKIS